MNAMTYSLQGHGSDGANRPGYDIIPRPAP